MVFIDYLTTAAPEFGPLAWIFFLAQILGVGAGAYLVFMHTERNPARYAFMRQLGIALMILTGVGVVLGILRLLDIPTMNMRLWFWIQLVLELGVAGYVVYYMRNVLPKLEREARARGLKPMPPRSQRTSAGGEALPPPPPQPVSTSGRRDARRERKRKTR